MSCPNIAPRSVHQLPHLHSLCAIEELHNALNLITRLVQYKYKDVLPMVAPIESWVVVLGFFSKDCIAGGPNGNLVRVFKLQLPLVSSVVSDCIKQRCKGQRSLPTHSDCVCDTEPPEDLKRDLMTYDLLRLDGELFNKFSETRGVLMPLVVVHTWWKIQRCRSEYVGAIRCSQSDVGVDVEIIERLAERNSDSAWSGRHVVERIDTIRQEFQWLLILFYPFTCGFGSL